MYSEALHTSECEGKNNSQFTNLNIGLLHIEFFPLVLSWLFSYPQIQGSSIDITSRKKGSKKHVDSGKIFRTNNNLPEIFVKFVPSRLFLGVGPLPYMHFFHRSEMQIFLHPSFHQGPRGGTDWRTTSVVDGLRCFFELVAGSYIQVLKYVVNDRCSNWLGDLHWFVP